MKRTIALLLSALICLGSLLPAAFAEGLTVRLPAEGALINPGRAVVIAFDAPSAGQADVTLTKGTDSVTVSERFAAQAGYNALQWNGTSGGVPVGAGEWMLTVSLNGETASAAVTVGEAAPYFLYVNSTGELPAEIVFSVSEDAALNAGVYIDDAWTELPGMAAAKGENTFFWDGTVDGEFLSEGEYTLTLQLTSADGISSTQEHISLYAPGDLAEQIAASAAAAGATVFTPSYSSPYPDTSKASTYWNTPMDITDTEAIWKMLTADVTVLDNGSKKAQKQQLLIRSEPDENSRPTGVVTFVSQAVRVIERQDEWSLIECYTSSFHDTKVEAWAMLVQGWVPTKYLKTVTPNQHIGYVVDKLTQRLYVFQDGELYSTLLVSTGHVNEKQPWNETRSGEYLMIVPAVGGYVDEGMHVDMAIRYNDGDLIHQVPYRLGSDGKTKDFSAFESRLGTKASHGCIRVQRRKTAEGVSQEWIYKNKANNTKLVIWEDWQGRQIEAPSDDTVLYRTSGGKSYHSADHCYSVTKKDVTFTAFTYGELEDDEYAKLTRCTYCTPPLRRAEIDEINAQYAPGGDHDPLLTAFRRKYLDSIAGE